MLPRELNIYIPRHLTTCQGVIRNVNAAITVEEIINNIRVNEAKKVLKARRLNCRVKVDDEIKYESTKTVVLTFKGSLLPKKVSLYYVPLEVSTYVLPVIRCTKCLRFGHNAKACKSLQRCRDCGLAPHPDTSCQVKCIHCGDKHNALSPECNELKRQQSIKKLMSFENITFYEAAKHFPRLSVPEPSDHNNFSRRPQLFPNTLSQSSQNNAQFYPLGDHTYANAARAPAARAPAPAKKKRPLSPGYNRDEVNNLLWSQMGIHHPLANHQQHTRSL